MLSPPGELLCTVHCARAFSHPTGHDECCRDAPPLVRCRQGIMSSESGHPCANAAGKLNLTADQVSRGLLYRQHVLGVLDRYIPEACHCATYILWQ